MFELTKMKFYFQKIMKSEEKIRKNNDFDWLSDGFARTLTYKLSEIEKLNVNLPFL